MTTYTPEGDGLPDFSIPAQEASYKKPIIKPWAKLLWIGAAALEAVDGDNPGLAREAGFGTLSFSRRKEGGYWFLGKHPSGALTDLPPEEEVLALCREVEDRLSMQGGEGFGDGLPAIRSMKAFLARMRKVYPARSSTQPRR